MHPANRIQQRWAVFMLLLAAGFWGVSFPVVKALAQLHEHLLPGAGAWFSVSYAVAPRFVLAAMVLLFWQGRRVFTLTRGELTQGVIIGLFLAAGTLLQTAGLRYTAASTSAFLTQFYAILIPIYVAVRARRNPGSRVWVSSVLVLVGVAIIGGFDWRELGFGRGEWLTLLASIFYMGQILWLEKRVYSANRPGMISLVMFATLGVVFGACLVVSAPDPAALVMPWTSSAWLGLTLILTAFCTLGSFSLMNTWQPKITATEAGLIYSLEPVFASLMALFLPALFSAWAGLNYLNETATWTLLAGGGLILLANVFIQFRPLPQLEQAEARANL